jgi:hypothetical protein
MDWFEVNGEFGCHGKTECDAKANWQWNFVVWKQLYIAYPRYVCVNSLTFRIWRLTVSTSASLWASRRAHLRMRTNGLGGSLRMMEETQSAALILLRLKHVLIYQTFLATTLFSHNGTRRKSYATLPRKSLLTKTSVNVISRSGGGIMAFHLVCLP